MPANPSDDGAMLPLDPRYPVWERVFTVSPLVVVGTREDGRPNLAPKHMATPLGWEGYFGFVCTPAHSTYHNARERGCFTVSFPGVDQLLVTTLTATPRCEGQEPKPVLRALPTEEARQVDAPVLRDAHLVLECELERVVDGFGEASLVVGWTVAARAHRDALRSSDVDDEEVLDRSPLLAFLSPERFAEVSVSHLFPLPEGFER